MKILRSLPAIFILFFIGISTAQQTYTVGGEQFQLQPEVTGSLTLLWNVIDGEYRYFVQKNNEIVELKNTKQGGKYQEEYKITLSNLTADAPILVEKTNFTLAGLKKYTNAYNFKKDPNYAVESPSIQVKTRLGGFVGLSNNIFTDNVTNAFSPIAGIDFELLDEVKLKRHAIVLRFKQSFKSDETNFSASQIALHYRFKFIKTEKFDAYIGAKFVAFTYVERDVLSGNPPVAIAQSGGDLTTPAQFGLGADYKLGNGYLTFSYNDIIGIGIDSNGEFPSEFAVGYKFNL